MNIWHVLTISAGVFFGWLFIWTFYMGARGRQIMWRQIKCWCGRHASGPVQAAVGGRNVQRCLYCDKIVYEYQVSKGTVRRVV